MKKIVYVLMFASCIIQAWAQKPLNTAEPATLVDPFIGTDAHGHTFPGAAVPFGMVQLSPDTRLTGWDGCSGYHYSDSVIYGFSHTHLSGTGVSDYGDVLLMPVTGKVQLNNELYSSPFRKEHEFAQPGYYRVLLDKPGVLAEMTSTARTGFHRYTFPQNRNSHLIIDLEHRDEVIESFIEFTGTNEIRGLRRSKAWAEDQHVFFVMRFSRDFSDAGIETGGSTLRTIAGRVVSEKIKAWVSFDTREEEQVLVKVGISSVSIEGAIQNLETENPHWDFDHVKTKAYDAWNHELSKIIVHGGSREQQIVFYTALYHCMLAPYLFSDVDGQYRSTPTTVDKAEGYDNYTVFSLWDTYRTLHPLLTIIDRKRTNDFIRSFLSRYEHAGLLPVWDLAGNETFCMIGYHSVPVIVDAWMKGIRDFNAELAFEAMKNSAMQDHFGLNAYRRYGHIPADIEHESVSKTLEYAYDDWCIAQIALELNRTEDYRYYLQRAQYYKNIFDPQTGFMRPRINGGWIHPFDPAEVNMHFTEANSWQYSFYVPQDLSGWTNMLGGKSVLSSMLDNLFETEVPLTGRTQVDITGLIGQYAHGNEPSHHMAYLFNFVEEPWKTQKWVRKIMDRLYSAEPDGLCGNEDCGQMSAWLVMSALGFYPLTPGLPEYSIGTPWFPEAEIRLENGKIFRIKAPGVNENNIYVQSLHLNGIQSQRSFFHHKELAEGGELLFEMGPSPNPYWGTGKGNYPVTSIDEYLINPVPWFTSNQKIFRDSLEVGLKTSIEGSEIYLLSAGEGGKTIKTKYEEPFYIHENASFVAMSVHPELGESYPIEASYFKILDDRKISLRSVYSRQYHAGGPEGLIDGLRGSLNWRTGGWQGYQNTDFEAIVDLLESRQISHIAAGFLQDVRSWIWMPAEVGFWISEDGDHFTLAGTLFNDIPADDYQVSIRDYGMNVDLKARYVMVRAKNYGEIPAWHPGYGGKAFIFTDEIIIR